MYREIKKLIDGNKEFRKKFFNTDNKIFDALVEYGQKPKIMVISCSDSRVDPAMIFNCEPGDLFVIRNVANLVPPYEDNDTYHGTSAALEFGTCFLQVKHVIILGHTKCGGIQALLESADNLLDKQNHNFIAKWMELARPAYDKIIKQYNDASLENKITLCEQYALINSLNNLQSFPWVKERVDNNELSLHAWYFDLATGIIYAHDTQKNSWLPLE